MFQFLKPKTKALPFQEVVDDPLKAATLSRAFNDYDGSQIDNLMSISAYLTINLRDGILNSNDCSQADVEDYWQNHIVICEKIHAFLQSFSDDIASTLFEIEHKKMFLCGQSLTITGIIKDLMQIKKEVFPPRKRKKKIKLALKIAFWKKVLAQNEERLKSLKEEVLKKAPLDKIFSVLHSCTHEKIVMKVVSHGLFTTGGFECAICDRYLCNEDAFVGCFKCKYYTCNNCCPVDKAVKKLVGTCGHCGRGIEAKWQCPCGKVYCSRSHQKKHWMFHRIACKFTSKSK